MSLGAGAQERGAADGRSLPVCASRMKALRSWGAPVSSLRHATGERKELLGRLGIRCVRDELFAIPSRYLDFTKASSVLDAVIGQDVTVLVRVDSVTTKRPRPKMTIVEVSCYDDTAAFIATFFGQPWMANRLHAGQLVAFSGRIDFSYGYKRMKSPFYDVVADEADKALGPGAARPAARMLPIYHVTEGLIMGWARRIAACAVADYADVPDWWPAAFRRQRGIMSIARALRSIHAPADADEAEQARLRLAFDEAVFLQLGLRAARDASLPGVNPVRHRVDGHLTEKIRQVLPFSLTEDQESAVSAILRDMAGDRPMSRLLLGDVGTGKTAVATCLLGAVADTGTQAAVMAPTGVLAQQYALKVGPVLDEAGIPWALLTGATPPRDRAQILDRLATGEVCVLFGTHALISEDVAFRRLSLVIIDEQQRFGVAQRHALREKGRGADLLVMTATPIPRTMALSIYGDLDCSYLRTRPNAGAGVTTHVIDKRNRSDAYDAMRAALARGHQCYVVCPLIGAPAGKDADDAAERLAQGLDPSDMKAAETEVEVLANKVFPGTSVGLLTGRMKPAEKARVMDDFRAKRIMVLVSTTVIEVGVDVPNATVMLVEDGERFGLAQLHQLRGRVGRGDTPGEVYIAANAKSEASRARMKALETTSDGFELAEADLRIRREGDILGTRQSGGVSLRYVDLARDADLLAQARLDAREMLARDHRLDSRELRPVRDELIARHGDVFKEVSGG